MKASEPVANVLRRDYIGRRRAYSGIVAERGFNNVSGINMGMCCDARPVDREPVTVYNPAPVA
jgi:hypothetical protein